MSIIGIYSQCKFLCDQLIKNICNTSLILIIIIVGKITMYANSVVE